MPAFLTSKAEFDACIRKNPAVVVDFTASWCGPCRMIAPHFEGMEREFPTVVFKKVDVDDNREAAAEAGVRAMPTFVMYRDCRQVDTVTGADPSKLRDMIRRHAPATRPAMPPREPHVSAGLFTKTDAATAIQKVQQNDGILLAFACGDDEPSKTMKTTLDVARFAAISTQYNIVFLLLQSGTPDFDNFKQMYPVLCVPSVYFIGPDGAVLHFIAGAKSEGEIRDALRTAIQKKKGKVEAESSAPAAAGPSDASPAAASGVPEAPAALPPSDNGDMIAAESKDAQEGGSAVEKSAREKALELQEKLRHKRQEEAKEKERQDEIRRRNDGKLMQDCRQRTEEATRKTNLEQMAKKRREEEEQDRLHREKLRRQLEEDRRARKLQGGVEGRRGKDDAPPLGDASSASTSTPAARPTSDTARIKVTLLSGEAVTETFQATDPFQVVLDFVTARQPGLQFVLLQSFPRRRYTSEDSAQTLAELGLVPNVALLSSPVEGTNQGTTSSSSSAGTGGGGGLLSWLSGFLPSTVANSTVVAPTQASPAPAANPQQPQWGARIARLHDGSEEPKEKETFYNGNTTEFKG